MQINLTRLTPSANLLPSGKQVFLVEYRAASSGDNATPDDGFFLQRRMPDGTTRTEAVCSLPQMKSLPFGAPNAEAPVFRYSKAVFAAFSEAELSEVHNYVLAQLSRLTADWNAIQTMAVESTTTIDGTGVFSSDQAGALPGVSTYASIKFKDDRSAILVYDVNGVLVAEIPILLPS